MLTEEGATVKIACVGAGPAGLYLSILLKLRNPQHQITVYERRMANSATGWGVTFGTTLLEQLYEQDRESAESIHQAALLWTEEVVHIRGERLSAHCGTSYNISRRLLLEILSDRARQLGVRIEYGSEISGLLEIPETDLFIAADGVSSKVREEIEGFHTQNSYGRNKYIWLGTDNVFSEFNCFFVPTTCGWIWAHAYGIDSESSTFVVECTPETWAGLGFDSMSTDEALPALTEIFKDYLAGHRLLGDLGDGSKARWLNFRTIINQHWYCNNTVLIGDSAHTAHFAIGMGTTLAIEDAIALADSLSQHRNLDAALHFYEMKRRAEVLPILTEARCSARWFEDISRYVALKPQWFKELFFARRSPLIALLPPTISYVLLQGASRISFINVIRALAAEAANMIYSRLKLLWPTGQERASVTSAPTENPRSKSWEYREDNLRRG